MRKQMITAVFVIAIALRTVTKIELRVGELCTAADAALMLCYLLALGISGVRLAAIILPVAPLLSSVISPSEVPLPSGLTRTPESFCLEKIDQEVHE